MKKIVFAILVCMLPALFFACASLRKDILVDSSRDQMEKSLAKLEVVIIPLEAAGGTGARKQQTEMASARRMIGDMEKEAIADADYSGRLIAWSGRLAILEGKYSDAQRLYRQSQALSPGNIPAVILGIRLEGNPAKRMELAEEKLALIDRHSPLSGFGELHIEKGRSLMELQRFAEAVSAFDTAFTSSLDGIYRETYRKDRDRAWELRYFDGRGNATGTLGILERGGLSWKDCISLAKSETQLLRFLTGGRDINEAELFNRLVERSFIPYTQNITVSEWPNAKPKMEDEVSRSGAAWFIWHLYAESRADRGLLSRYSARYATGLNPRSPITDVPPLSPFFDSILGCVETEFMSLPDGKNFNPLGTIRGAELLAILKNMDK
jgi:tetratricopeptide (TPR) repeat protein